MPEETDYDSMSIEELEKESAKNPVEKAAPEPEAEAEVQAQEPEAKQHMIPQDRFNEVNEARKHAEAMLAHYQNNAIQRAQQVQAPKKQPTAAEIAEFQANQELLNPYIGPVVQELNELKAEVINYKVEKLANEAERYVRNFVPDFDSVAPEMFALIKSKPQSLQDTILGNPDLVIEYANITKAMIAAGQTNKTTTVKQDLKKRAVSESGGSSNPPVRTSSKIDPEYERIILHGTTDELTAYERKKGIK